MNHPLVCCKLSAAVWARYGLRRDLLLVVLAQLRTLAKATEAFLTRGTEEGRAFWKFGVTRHDRAVWLKLTERPTRYATLRHQERAVGMNFEQNMTKCTDI